MGFDVGDLVMWNQPVHGIVVKVYERGGFDVRFHGQDHTWAFDSGEFGQFHLLKGMGDGEEE